MYWIVGLLFAAGLLAFAPEGHAHPPQQASLVGCLSALPAEGLVLSSARSGKVYALQGNLTLLLAHQLQLVRVYGQEHVTSGQPRPEFTVSKLEVVADACTAQPPVSRPVPVAGKTGPEAVAVPIGTTSTPGEVTGIPQHRPAMAQPSSRRYGPPNQEQAGQSPAEANLEAEAAAETEIEPGRTLGVNAPAVQTPSAPAAPAPGTAKLPAAGKVVVVRMEGDELQFVPPRITVTAGTTVEWVNSGKVVHDVVDNSAKAANQSDVQLPAGGQSFDSGYLQPGMSFKHTFTVPGVYRYVCTLHEVQHMLGEVIVKR